MSIDKKNIIGLAMAAILVLVLIIVLFSLPKERPSVPEEMTEEETIIEKELRELEEMREGVAPLTEEETQSQLEELEELREGVEPLSDEQIRKETEQLKMLR